jgi:hypothetical protein
MNYAHLDELWDDYPPSGKTVTSSRKKSGSKKKCGRKDNKAAGVPEEPLCDLYSQRELPMEPPYYQQMAVYDNNAGPRPNARDLGFQHVMVTAEDSTYDTYSSYNDDDMYLMSAADKIQNPISYPAIRSETNTTLGTLGTKAEEDDAEVEADIDAEITNQYTVSPSEDYMAKEPHYLQRYDNTFTEYGNQMTNLRSDLKTLQNMMTDVANNASHGKRSFWTLPCLLLEASCSYSSWSSFCK